MSKARASLSVCLIAGLIGASPPAHAREIRKLPPSSKWVVNYADENCRLARSFGEGRDQVTLVLDQFAPGDWFRVTLAGHAFEPRNLKPPAEARLRFGANEKSSEITGFAANLGPLPAYIAVSALRMAPFTDGEKKAAVAAYRRGNRFDPSPTGADRERAATWLEIGRLMKDLDIVLETGRMDQAMNALRQCMWDTVRSWGMDVDQQKKLSRKPIPRKPLQTIFSPSDYPRKLARDGQQGLVNVRLILDEKGVVETCVIQKSTRPKDFDDVVCRVLVLRARFNPALDESGKPVRSFYNQGVIFQIG